MASVLMSVADAVVSALNAGTFVRSFVADRAYDTTEEIEQLATLRVDVIPVGEKVASDSRKAFEYAPQVDVGVRYKFQRSDQDGDNRIQNEETDALVELVEQIHEHMRSKTYRRLPGYTDAILRTTEITPWVPSHMVDLRQFTGIVRLTYRLEKDIDT